MSAVIHMRRYTVNPAVYRNEALRKHAEKMMVDDFLDRVGQEPEHREWTHYRAKFDTDEDGEEVLIPEHYVFYMEATT